MAFVAKQLGRKKAHREHMLRNLGTSVILFEKVDTTLPKARQVSSMVERWISAGKENTLASRRRLLSQSFDKMAVKKIFEVLSKRYESRAGGYVRVVKLGNRIGDGAMMARIELIDVASATEETPKTEEVKKPAKKTTAKKSVTKEVDDEKN